MTPTAADILTLYDFWGPRELESLLGVPQKVTFKAWHDGKLQYYRRAGPHDFVVARQYIVEWLATDSDEALRPVPTARAIEIFQRTHAMRIENLAVIPRR